MSDALAVKTGLEERFPALRDAVRVQREKRLWVAVDRALFDDVFAHATGELGFVILCTITGLDEGTDLGFLYHLAREGGMMLNIEVRVPKGTPWHTVTDRFPGAAIYERECEDLLGAKIEGTPAGARYPLPEDWPSDEHPLLKDWKPRLAYTPEEGVKKDE
jgi:membrane-bound hydrogenase subunit beta